MIDAHSAAVMARFHYGGWFAGLIVIVVGAILPFLYIGARHKGAQSLGDLFKRK